jgi:hypothetical protein
MKTITTTGLMGLVMLVPVAVSAQFLAVLTVLSAESDSSTESLAGKVSVWKSPKARAPRVDVLAPVIAL